MHRKPPIPPSEKPGEGRYRTYAAQDIHKIVLQFLHGRIKTSEVYERFEQIYQTAKTSQYFSDPFIITSVHGHTVLIDTLHLALPIAREHYSEPEATRMAIEKANCLLQLIFASAKDINSKRFLITTADEHGLTPVHAILQLGDSTMLRSLLEQVEECLTPEEIRDLVYEEHKKAMRVWCDNNAALYGTIPEYFDFLYKLFSKGVINAVDIGRFLTTIDEHGYSFFYKILLTHNEEIATNAINCLKAAPHSFSYRLLTQFTRDLYTVMHYACASPTAAILIELLALGRQLVLNQMSAARLTAAEYSSLFCSATHSGFTPAHFVFGNKDNRCAEIYIREIEWGTAEGLVTVKNLKMLWLARADNKSTALSYAIESNKVENIQGYLNVLSRLHRTNSPDAITYTEMLALLQQPTLNGRSILHLAAETGNLRCIQELVKFIRLEMLNDAAELLTTLFNTDPHRNLPHCPLQDEEGMKVNSYLAKLRTLTTIKDPAELDRMLKDYEYQEQTASGISSWMTPGVFFTATVPSVGPVTQLPTKRVDFSSDIPPAAPPPPLPGEKRQQFDNKNTGGTPKAKR